MSAGRFCTLGAAVLTIGLAAGAVDARGQAQPQMTDAQIEANVLRALAGAPDLSTQNIQTSTVYGTVTLTGNVHDETLRTKAENLAARAQGVKKVVDELTLGDTPATPAADASAQGQPGMPSEQPDGSAQANQPVLLSDGTYGPAPDGSGAQAAPPADAQAAPSPDSRCIRGTTGTTHHRTTRRFRAGSRLVWRLRFRMVRCCGFASTAAWTQTTFSRVRPLTV